MCNNHVQLLRRGQSYLPLLPLLNVWLDSVQTARSSRMCTVATTVTNVSLTCLIIYAERWQRHVRVISWWLTCFQNANPVSDQLTEAHIMSLECLLHIVDAIQAMTAEGAPIEPVGPLMMMMVNNALCRIFYLRLPYDGSGCTSDSSCQAQNCSTVMVANARESLS